MPKQLDRADVETVRLLDRAAEAEDTPAANRDDWTRNLVVEMALSFVRASAAELDEQINRWLQKVVTHFDLERTTVAEWDAATGLATISHGWARDSSQLLGRTLYIGAALPWLVRMITSGRTVIYGRIQDLPPEAATDIRNFGSILPRANVTFPIRLGGAVIGGIGFGMITREREWTPETVAQLRLVAEILGAALGRKHSEREIADLRDDVTYLSRVTSMGELAAALAHELNQPLAAIRANAEASQNLLRSATPDLVEVGEAIDDIVRDDARASDIIGQLRAMFRREEPKHDVMHPAEMVREAARLLQHDARMRGITFSLDIEPHLPPLQGDRTQLQQVLINLVVNAFEAVSAARGGPREVAVHLTRRGADFLTLGVSDTGIGIAPEVVSQIFNPFFTTKSRGMGIGLSLSKSIVEAHHGHLTATPNEARGTTVEISLPIAHDQGP